MEVRLSPNTTWIPLHGIQEHPQVPQKRVPSPPQSPCWVTSCLSASHSSSQGSLKHGDLLKEGARLRGQEVVGHRELGVLLFQVNMSSSEGPQRKTSGPHDRGSGNTFQILVRKKKCISHSEEPQGFRTGEALGGQLLLLRIARGPSTSWSSQGQELSLLHHL